MGGDRYKRAKEEAEKLGMPMGTAAGKLRKTILFNIIKKYGENKCYRCGELIENEKELSIEHKKAWFWEEDPKESFFDLNNIAFSHLVCNVRESCSRKQKVQHVKYGRNKCNCVKCIDYRKRYTNNWHNKNRYRIKDRINEDRRNKRREFRKENPIKIRRETKGLIGRPILVYKDNILIGEYNNIRLTAKFFEVSNSYITDLIKKPSTKGKLANIIFQYKDGKGTRQGKYHYK